MTETINRPRWRARRSFSLIELLVVAAIVAVLALATTSARRDYQIRSKVSRTQSDMLRVGRAVAAYVLDHDQIPMISRTTTDFYPTYLYKADTQRSYPGHRLTSPIAYLSPIPIDHFNTNLMSKTSWNTSGVPVSFVADWAPLGLDDYPNRNAWINTPRRTGEAMADFFPCRNIHMILESGGPGLVWWDYALWGNAPQTDVNPYFYDPTNGATSWGQILYFDCGGLMPGM